MPSMQEVVKGVSCRWQDFKLRARSGVYIGKAMVKLD